MTNPGSNRGDRLADAAAEREAAAVANGNLEEAGNVASYQSKRRFSRLIEILLMGGCILVFIIWSLSAIACFLYFVLPSKYEWLTAENDHMLLSFVCGGLVTSFASNYIQHKLK